MMRFHRKFNALRCWVLFFGWLAILLIVLSYWHSQSEVVAPVPISPDKILAIQKGSTDDLSKFKKIQQVCNLPELITRNQEGNLPSEYQLIGVVIFIRHGDRGPLIPIKDLVSVDCGRRVANSSEYRRYINAALAFSRSPEFAAFAGTSFSRLAPLPLPSQCTVGHLTPQGIVQHLRLGSLMRTVYLDELRLLGGLLAAEVLDPDDVIVYSTKYRRTFQSGLAFLYAFFGGRFFPLHGGEGGRRGVQLREGRGVTFCEHECGCRHLERLDSHSEEDRRLYRSSHPGLSDLVARVGPLLRTGTPGGEDFSHPATVRDALLTYACHGAPLPCSVADHCARLEDLAGLLSFEEWESKRQRTSASRQAGKLRTFGVLKNLLASMHGMVAQMAKPKMVLYSGHDKTLKYLLEGLGLRSYPMPHYAARLIWEVYKNTSYVANTLSAGKQVLYNSVTSRYSPYHFRLVYDGKDVTRQLPFCRTGSAVTTVRHLFDGPVKSGGLSLCRFDEIRQYLDPEKYFAEFNASSFSEACNKEYE